MAVLEWEKHRAGSGAEQRSVERSSVERSSVEESLNSIVSKMENSFLICSVHFPPSLKS